MAVIGMRHPVATPITTETDGAAIVYGTGFVIAKAIRGNFTYNHNDNPLYADDTIAENDTGITGYDVELEIDKLSDAVRVNMLGDLTSGTETVVISQTDQSAPYVGFGFIRVLREAGDTKYQAVWCYKCQFYEPSEETNTKGESIEWGTPTLNATGMGVRIDSSGVIKYRDHATFATYAAAETWLNNLANVSSGTQVTPGQS